jgi:hypothetical protein
MFDLESDLCKSAIREIADLLQELILSAPVVALGPLQMG